MDGWRERGREGRGVDELLLRKDGQELRASALSISNWGVILCTQSSSGHNHSFPQVIIY